MFLLALKRHATDFKAPKCDRGFVSLSFFLTPTDPFTIIGPLIPWINKSKEVLRPKITKGSVGTIFRQADCGVAKIRVSLFVRMNRGPILCDIL